MGYSSAVGGRRKFAKDIMKIKINGKENTIQGMNSLIDLIKNRGFQDSSIVIEHNLKVIPREKWTEVMLRDGDRLEIVSFVGGG